MFCFTTFFFFFDSCRHAQRRRKEIYIDKLAARMNNCVRIFVNMEEFSGAFMKQYERKKCRQDCVCETKKEERINRLV
jgi:hypothetical protein